MADGTSENNDPISEVGEPSMEDILASIRQLIAHDEGGNSKETVSIGVSDTAETVKILTDDDITPTPTDNALELMQTPRDNAVHIPQVQLVDTVDSPVDEMLEGLIDIDVPVSAAQIAAPEFFEGESSEAEALESGWEDDLLESFDLDIPEPKTPQGGQGAADSLQGDIDLNALLEESFPAPNEEVDVDVIDSLFDSMNDAQEPDVDEQLAALVESAPVESAPVESVMTALEQPVSAVLTDDNTAGLDDLMNELSGDMDLDAPDSPISDSIMPDASLSLAERENINSPDVAEDVNINKVGAVQPDPDLELVRSLVAELTGESISLDEVSASDETIHLDEPRDDLQAEPASGHADIQSQPVEHDEGALLDDLLNDIIQNDAADLEESKSVMDAGPSVETVSDVEADVDGLLENIIADVDIGADIVEDAPETAHSPLTVLANEIETADTLDMEDASAATGAGLVLGATSAVGLAATLAAAPKISALDNLLDGSEAAATPDPLNLDDMVTANLTLDGSGMDGDARDNDLGAAIEALLDDIPDDVDLGTEIDVPELDIIDENTEVNTDAVLDPAQETVEVKVDKSQMEIEDMAGKNVQGTILSEVTETATSSAFASLNQVVEEKNIVEQRGDRIGDLVTAALEPMLKEWLDKNLKTIVERAVTKEVKRISSGK